MQHFSISDVGINDMFLSDVEARGWLWQWRKVTCRTRERAPDPAIRVFRPLSSAPTWSCKARDPTTMHKSARNICSRR